MAALRVRGRASILSALALLVVAPGARADVLVPSDPPPPRAPGAVSCIAAAGEALAYQHEVGAAKGGERAPTVAQLDPGPLQSITLGRPVRIDDCPTAAGAADGTAAVGFLSIPGGILSSAPRIVVRRPGGAFGAPLRVGGTAADSLMAPAVAAAPGGWVAAAWVQEADQTQIAAAVIAPDGTVSTAVLDAGPLFDTGYSWPRVGIDANGAATVAWTRWTLVDEERPTLEHVRLARSARGATGWEPTRDLAVGARGSTDEVGDGRVGLAVTPGGRVLAAWSNGLAVRAIEGDESGLGAPATLASIAGAGVPSAVLTDDGAAVVPFSQVDPSDDERTQVFAVQRAPGGAWSAPQRLSGPLIDASAAPREGRPSAGDGGSGDVPLATALAPDGRTLVAWSATDSASFAERVVAVTGRAGGPWAPVRMLSIPTRESHGTPAAALDAAGDPRVVWVEDSLVPRARVHADRLESDAQAPPPDTSAPRLTVTLPRTVRLNRRGVQTLRLTVRCSEACDLRADVRIPADAVPEAAGLRAVAAGARAVVTIRQIGTEDFLGDIKPRHMRLDVLAADRAGNVTVRTRLLAVLRP